MKKKITAILSVVICLAVLCTLCAACMTKAVKSWESNEIVDDGNPYYKDYYHIFVYSFADGNGDGIGDLKGIEQKLDYIANLGFTGIWLSPISPSETYHKYDVTDYLNVDPEYGTLDDFKSLVSKAHEKGISVMLDIVINHSSYKHPWFVEAQKAHRNGNVGNKYYDYYIFNSEDGSVYETFGNYTHMPKLNLDNAGVREEIDNICKFWLQDYSVDAFRLDAAYHYYNGNAGDNIKFMQWLTATARKYNENVYMVGEVMESDSVVYAHYAEDSVQSFFNFALSNSYSKLNPAISVGTIDKAGKLQEVITAKEKGTAKGIDALFTSNHDTSRISNLGLNYFSTRQQEVTTDLFERHKMGVALLYTQTGNVFNYYGNEIGMRNGVRRDPREDYVDQTYRLAMNWGDRTSITHENGFAYQAYGVDTLFGAYEDYLGGVAEQIDDQNSLYNFYRRVMLLRRQNPEIARGTSAFVAYEDTDVALIVRTYNGKSILLAYNLNGTESKTVDIAKVIADNGLEGKLAGFLSSDNGRDVGMRGSALTLPQFSIAVVR